MSSLSFLRVLFASTLLVSLAVVLEPTGADAQTRLRRPYNEAHRLNYGFDNNGSAAGCSDYTCAGACYNGQTGSDFGNPIGTVTNSAR